MLNFRKELDTGFQPLTRLSFFRTDPDLVFIYILKVFRK